LPLPQGTPKAPQGIAALTVKAGAPEPFTKNDVVNYFATHSSHDLWNTRPVSRGQT
jgi:hypothetical protein